MNTLALTGGIACGKSLFGSFLAQLGADVVDTDDLREHFEVVLHGGGVYHALPPRGKRWEGLWAGSHFVTIKDTERKRGRN